MSYTPFVFFGYEIQHPSETDLREFISMMYDLNGMIGSPFEIRCILPTFYPTMNEEDYARVVIGFVPEQIEEMIDHSTELKSFIDNTPLLDGMEVAQSPMFHCGIEWRPEIGSDSELDESDEESDVSDVSDDIEDDDDDNSDVSDDVYDEYSDND